MFKKNTFRTITQGASVFRLGSSLQWRLWILGTGVWWHQLSLCYLNYTIVHRLL